MSTSGSPVRRHLLVAALAVAATTAAVRPAAAHVRYVTDTPDGGSLAFAVEVLSEPINAVLIGVTGGVAVLGVGSYLWVRPTIPDVDVLRSALAEYLTYIPWMLRLSLGLPLIGAGFVGYLFSPAVPAGDLPAAVQPYWRLVGIGLGFLLLFGVATRAVAAVGILVYLGALAAYPRAILAIEYLPGFLAIVLLGSGRPSADHLLGRLAAAKGTYYSRVDPIHVRARRIQRRIDPYTAYVPVILRVGLGVGFVYLGLFEKLANPEPGLAVVQQYGLTNLVPVDPGMWVVGAGLAEITFGIALLAGLLTRATAAGAFVLFTLTLFGLKNDPVLAHITLFGIASAVFTLGAGPLSVDAWLSRDADRQSAGAPARG